MFGRITRQVLESRDPFGRRDDLERRLFERFHPLEEIGPCPALVVVDNVVYGDIIIVIGGLW